MDRIGLPQPRFRGCLLEKIKMNAQRVVAILLIVAGALALGYGGFSYTKETHEATVGPINLSVDEKQYVNVPVWAGVGAMVVGGLLLFPGRKS